MVIVSSLPKLDAFQISENLAKRKMLTHLYTGYATQKQRLINRFVNRKDSEDIPGHLITDLWPLILLQRFHTNSSIYNEIYDRIVAAKIKKRNDYKAILGWSGMSEHTLVEAKRKNKFTVVARGSCHIELQNEILTAEFKKYGLAFSIDKRIMRKELFEYDIADKIYVCSSFVKNSFLEKGFSADKIFVNPIAVPKLFKPAPVDKRSDKFIILFLGKLTIQKGSRYLFEALEKLSLSSKDYEVWFVGASDDIIEKEFHRRKKDNWKYYGFIPQHKLPDVISHADIGVFPSIQDGFAQVVPQQLSCGVPVITTRNTGASDFVTDGYNGYVVDAYDSDAIAERITKVFNDKELHKQMTLNAAKINFSDLSIDAVAKRFELFFKLNIG
jgi:glycosyltransferase involved in cell wall biosynthesis